MENPWCCISNAIRVREARDARARVSAAALQLCGAVVQARASRKTSKRSAVPVTRPWNREGPTPKFTTTRTGTFRVFAMADWRKWVAYGPRSNSDADTPRSVIVAPDVHTGVGAGVGLAVGWRVGLGVGRGVVRAGEGVGRLVGLSVGDGVKTGDT